jgi:hypothetical protein
LAESVFVIYRTNGRTYIWLGCVRKLKIVGSVNLEPNFYDGSRKVVQRYRLIFLKEKWEVVLKIHVPATQQALYKEIQAYSVKKAITNLKNRTKNYRKNYVEN